MQVDRITLVMKSLHANFVRQLDLEELPEGASGDTDMEDADKDRIAFLHGWS